VLRRASWHGALQVKQRHGVIERLEAGGASAVCRGMFKRETDQSLFVGLRVVSGQGDSGTIHCSFGKSGKFRVQWDAPIAGALEDRTAEGNQLLLQYKKFTYAAAGKGKILQ
jgi:selenocysteine-specific elongation factor